MMGGSGTIISPQAINQGINTWVLGIVYLLARVQVEGLREKEKRYKKIRVTSFAFVHK